MNETIDGRDINTICNSFIHVSARAKFLAENSVDSVNYRIIMVVVELAS